MAEARNGCFHTIVLNLQSRPYLHSNAYAY